MKVKLIIISIILLLVMVFACGCIPFMEKIGLINPTNEEQLSPEKGGPPDGLVKVLIGFKEKPGPAQQAMVKGVGGQIKYTYHIVDAIAASIPEKAIDALRKNPNITNVDLDSKVYALETELESSWGVEHIGAGIVHDSNNKGSGVKVAIIDSGVDYTHEDLDANFDTALLGYDFVNNDNYPMDDDGHGTHVAGTVAAEDNGSGVVGVAPEANLYALKVLEGGSGYWSDIIAALEWCVNHGIEVTNNSYGSSINPGVTVKAAFDNSADAGVLHVAAAGNSGNPRGKGNNVEYPARFESVIAVAATDKSDKRASFSSTGNAVELAAPGVNINSTLPGDDYSGEKWSGTSMASPHVAGTAALVIAAGIYDVRAQLQNTADDLGVTGWDSKYGYGLVDAYEAVGVSGEEPPPVTGTMYVESIIFDSKIAGPNNFLYTAVKVVDSEGSPLANVRVEMTLTHDSGSSWDFADDTGTDGTVKFTLVKAQNGYYTAEVIKLAFTGYEWDKDPSKGVISSGYVL
jgi:subtilisin